MKLKTEMRRQDRQITDFAHVETVLKEAPFGILSMCRDDSPYSIPVNFYYEKGKIYIHCAKTGQKVQYVQENPSVCFLVMHAVDSPEKECAGAVNYESVLCFGKASFSETSTREILLAIGGKYQVCEDVTEEDCQNTAVIEVEIEEVSAKQG